MDRQQLQHLASDWVRVAKNDIRKKVLDFMREEYASERDLAYALTISEAELAQIIQGNGEITLSTFAKLLIATGHALEIKPIEETPIGCYENIPEEMPPIPHQRPNMFGRPTPTRRPHIPMDFESQTETQDLNEEEEFDMPQPRDSRGRFMSPRRRMVEPHEEPQNLSPFARMNRDKLVDIIREKLWDSEIDTDSATTSELVLFLEEKDRRIKEYKQIKEIENDPQVSEFKNRLKRTVKENPHLRNWVKGFLGDLEED